MAHTRKNTPLDKARCALKFPGDGHHEGAFEASSIKISICFDRARDVKVSDEAEMEKYIQGTMM
jgi:hypothetical protein